MTDSTAVDFEGRASLGRGQAVLPDVLTFLPLWGESRLAPIFPPNFKQEIFPMPFEPYPKMLNKPDPDKQAPYVTRIVQNPDEHDSARLDGWERRSS
jgi:hypothetical protein